MKKTFIYLSYGLISILPLAAQDIELRIDLGTTDSPGNWTNVNHLINSVDAIDFNTGENTGATVSHLFPSLGGAIENADVDWVVSTAFLDAGVSNFSGGSLTVSNLPAGVYDVEVVASSGFDSFSGTIEVNGQTASSTFRGTAVPAIWNANTDGTNPINWLVFDDVELTSSGKIDVIARISDGSFVAINAIRITGTTTTMPSVSNAVEVFGDTTNGNAWYRSNWFGWYNDVSSPWIFHNELSWFWLPDTSTSTEIWMYTLWGGWIFTSEAAFPSLYSVDLGVWLFYDTSSTIDQRWFFNFSTNEWINL
ncbi:hypothetical protein [Rubellicoccus peritrichatus]|uniref:Uncharacterized protein n=1 Tax=Rubellicoccus peritrichatus TaxID=3080537 RepID=A0AAQ3QTT5_9BACT|nr:hypothetical protein [Puniceicoccus sp. CR14]WOO39738.1 hypothetical protein RZN69_14030 [Puniceicoccus sp. CR14]